MKIHSLKSYIPGLFIVVLVVLGILLRIEQLESGRKFFSMSPWLPKYFFLGMLTASIALIFTAIFYRRWMMRFFALLLPVVLIVSIGWNASRLFTPASRRWNFKPLPSNTFLDLAQHCQNKLGVKLIYITIENFYQGKTLIVAPVFLETEGLTVEELKSFGGLKDVTIVNYDPNLSEQEKNDVMLTANTVIEADSGTTYIFVVDDSNLSDRLVLTRYEREVLFVPLHFLQDREY